jgi:hypothetical protein
MFCIIFLQFSFAVGSGSEDRCIIPDPKSLTYLYCVRIYGQLLKCMVTYHVYANMVYFRIALVLLLEKIPYCKYER